MKSANRKLLPAAVACLSGLFAECASVVNLPSGDMALEHTRLIGPESSGKVFRGADDGSTRLSAGVVITGWTDRVVRGRTDHGRRRTDEKLQLLDDGGLLCP